jgi:Zn-finger nucleic acid-binding protein
MKKCPICNIAMTPKNIGPVEIDECSKCKGVWFDKNELRRAKDAEDSDLNWKDFEIWKHKDQFKAKPSLLKCPVCKTATHAINYGSNHIEIDYCPTCKGTWLEKGEFKKIIHALEQQLLTESFSEYLRDTIEEAKEIITGPESFISEWKDFVTVLRLMQYRFFVEHPKLLDAIVVIQKATPFR